MSNQSKSPSPRFDQSLAQDRLDSWKEIASYLNRDVRTVQRWEKVAGLPVHRLQVEKGSSVYAYKSELDTWYREHQRRLEEEPEPGERRSWKWMAAVGIVVVIAAVVLGRWLLYARRARALTEKDTLVLADFTNATGDPVFDGTLRQGLAVQLEQSPFLSFLSEEGIHNTLQMMGQPAHTRLTPQISREICQRTTSAATLEGSIAQIGTQYSLILRAVNCVTGELLASTEAQARDKSHVLDALGRVGSEMRRKLGESLSTMQKYNTPLAQVTTPSLQALYAFTLGNKAAGGETLSLRCDFGREPHNSTQISRLLTRQ